METLLQDVHYAFRMLRRNSAFATVAVITLALGIGTNTAMFTVVNAVLLKSLPVKDPGQLVVIGDPRLVHDRWSGTPQSDIFSVPLYRQLDQSSSAVFNGMLASGEEHRVRVSGQNGEITSNATAALVSGNYFSVLGVNALFGRVFNTTEGARRANPVVVLSYSFWRDKLGSNQQVIGQPLLFNGHPYTVLGVTPTGFFGDTVGDLQDFWVPLSMEEDFIPRPSYLENYGASWLHLIARLKSGVPISRAKAVLNVRFQQLVEGPLGARDQRDREELKKEQIQVSAGGRGFSSLRGYFFRPLMFLAAMVGVLLFMACINVANLLLARAARRGREFAVRAAIGASPGRLARQLLTESLILAAAGGALGWIVAYWATEALIALSRDNQLHASPDLRVLLFTASACVLSGLIFGIIPALRVRRAAVAPALKCDQGTENAPGSFWNWGRALVTLQISISVLVLFAAGLLSRSLLNLRNLDLGYNREHLLVVTTNPLAGGYRPQRLAAFGNDMITRFTSIPGVRAASYSSHGLFSGGESELTIKFEGYVPGTAKNEDEVAADYVGPRYFAAVGSPIILGRDIGLQDTEKSQQVAVINESMAKRYFPGINPIGRRFVIEHVDTPRQELEIVGVAKDIRDHSLIGTIPPRFYMPLVQSPILAPLLFEIRTIGDPSGVAQTARKEIKEYDQNIPVYNTRPLDEILDGQMRNEIALARLSTFFGLLALALASVGLYGLMSYTVSRRTREIGVRMALGAQSGQVLQMVLQEAMKLVTIGILVGVPAALLVSRALNSMLFGLSAADPISMLIVILMLGTIAALAGFVPARRATKVDPIVALRYE